MSYPDPIRSTLAFLTANKLKTFGCSQSQQVIWELFDHVLKGWEASGDTDECFLRRVKDAYEKVYQGVRVGSWGQIQGQFLCPSCNVTR